MKTKLIFLAASLSLMACGGGVTPPLLGDTSNDIVKGTIDNGDRSVVALVYRDYDDKGKLVYFTGCTGVLVDPTHVVTDPGCVAAQPESVFTCTSLRKYPRSKHPECYIDVTSGYAHPDLDWLHETTHKVAVLTLAKAAGVKPKAMAMAALPAKAKGDTVRVIGFGINNVDQGTGDGTRRQMKVKIAALGPHAATGGNKVPLSDDELQTDERKRATCDFDEGGGVFMTLGGQEKLVAINNGGDMDCKRYGIYTEIGTDMCFFKRVGVTTAECGE